jgi:hypothetical protein
LHNRDKSTAIIAPMTNVLPITHNGQLVATDLAAADCPTVEAMCVYASEILHGRITKPYSDEDALAYADAIAAKRLANS